MKSNTLHTIILLAICIWFGSYTVFAQNMDKDVLIGTWETAGTIMGDNGEGWIMPHKHSAPDCGNDHTVFFADGNGKEVKYNTNCEPIEQPFQWKFEGSKVMLSRGEKNIAWHILSLEDNQLKVGIQIRSNSEYKMYVAYNKQQL
ncbi:MAG: hypothetical protein GYB37_15195 [Algicola sp.]|nr:hypothetical protein [Algicola sp.]